MVKVERTLNTGLCLEILYDKDIFGVISEDGATIHDLRVNVCDEYWVSMLVGDECIGVAQFKPMFNKCYDSHIHILKKYRKDYSLTAGRVLLDWCQANLKDCLLLATVPVFCPNVVNFLKAFGFSDDGLLKGAWLKNGKQNDIKILTRIV